MKNFIFFIKDILGDALYVFLMSITAAFGWHFGQIIIQSFK